MPTTRHAASRIHARLSCVLRCGGLQHLRPQSHGSIFLNTRFLFFAAMDETTHTECCQLSAKSTSLDSRWGSKLINKKQGCYRGAYGHMSGAAHAEMPKVEESFYALAKQHLSRSETATIKWQYIGSETGWYTIYPSAKQSRCDSYDPRFRPWYVASHLHWEHAHCSLRLNERCSGHSSPYLVCVVRCVRSCMLRVHVRTHPPPGTRRRRACRRRWLSSSTRAGAWGAP